MWMFKPFSGKEPAPLEGRAIDVGNVKIQVRNAIAEGGFSCVYVVQDAAHPSKHYALKHMICNDEESLDLVMKEISVAKLLKGHPNVVTLVAHALFDVGRRKEALLVMEFCEKSLVNVLESRGVGYYEEKQALLIFRDICNAVHAMHSQSPPIAHRDLKAENVLLGSDGSWKLCDFGSTSTNHKCFERPEEMGIEEDNIRKHTTPAYRAPEMWDLYRREVISEKVDIWALGCLLYRICYFKSAFDGESKLQILNGNYRIPDLPKYSSSIRDLIKDMLEASPNSRPDITQVWFRVNELLPLELQKHLPDSSTALASKNKQYEEGARRMPSMPHRSPPPVPSSQEQMHNVSPLKKDMDQRKSSQGASKSAGGPIGAFWSTEHAMDSAASGHNGFFDEEPFKQSEIKHHHASSGKKASPAPSRERSVSPVVQLNSGQGTSVRRFDNGNSGDFEMNFTQEKKHTSLKGKTSNSEAMPAFQDDKFNTFVAEFDVTKLDTVNATRSTSDQYNSRTRELQSEVDSLKEQLKKANLEKAEMTSKYEKLSAICRSQRQEIQGLKNALAAANQSSARDQQNEKKAEGTVWELEQGLSARTTSPATEPNSWHAFGSEPEFQATQGKKYGASHDTLNGHSQIASATRLSGDAWGSNLDNFTKSSANTPISTSVTRGNTSKTINNGAARKVESDQPAGWAGF